MLSTFPPQRAMGLAVLGAVLRRWEDRADGLRLSLRVSVPETTVEALAHSLRYSSGITAKVQYYLGERACVRACVHAVCSGVYRCVQARTDEHRSAGALQTETCRKTPCRRCSQAAWRGVAWRAAAASAAAPAAAAAAAAAAPDNDGDDDDDDDDDDESSR